MQSFRRLETQVETLPISQRLKKKARREVCQLNARQLEMLLFIRPRPRILLLLKQDVSLGDHESEVNTCTNLSFGEPEESSQLGS